MDKLNALIEGSCKGKILVATDEQAIIKFLCDFLSLHKFHIVGCSSGGAALEVLKGDKFDLLLADLRMPDMNGIELTRAALRMDSSLVCIMMTGYGTAETELEARKAGVYDYILKPFHLKRLVDLLSSAVEAGKSGS